jgi:hypothetical protein
MAHRNRIPLGQLAVLTVLTALFAVVGLRSSPHTPDLTVQNAADQTYTSNSFTLDLVFTVASGQGGGVLKQVRRIDYQSPNDLMVYQVSPNAKVLGKIAPSKIDASIDAYEKVTQGSALWVQHGNTFTRTESLVTYTTRTEPVTTSRTVSNVAGVVYETATVRAGYLVSVVLKVVVPNQTLAGGQQAPGAKIGETYQLEKINGGPVSSLGH